jgi:hypothetical protein
MSGTIPYILPAYLGNAFTHVQYKVGDIQCKGVIERTYPLSSPSTLDLVLLQNSKVLVLDDGKG